MDVLVNWLVQGGMVALAAAAALRLIPRSRTRARYSVAWTACTVVLALPFVPHLLAGPATLPAAVNTLSSLGPVIAMPSTWWTSTTFAIGLWMIWSTGCAVRLVGASIALRNARTQCVECPPSLDVQLHHWLRVKEKGRRTRLVISTRVRSASVLGGGSPVIALAPNLIEQLGNDDLDRVVIHEWAHVQRRDDIAQFAELLVRLVAGWHPAVWWLERQLHLEREVACDEMVVSQTGSAKGYATCLATLAALPPGPEPSLHALAAVSSSGLRARIVRILTAPCGGAAPPWRATAFCASVALAALAWVAGNVRIVESVVASLSLPAVSRPAFAGMMGALVSPLPHGVTTDRSFQQPAASRRSFPSHDRPTPETRGILSDRDFAPTVPEPEAETYASRQVEAKQWQSFIESPRPLLATAAPVRADVNARTPWGSAADAGVAIGRGSHDAGVATAGFFKRFGKTIAGSF